MEEKSIAQEITAKLQKKYGRVIEIGRLTDELTEALSRNDKQSVNMVLSMRGEEMDAVDTLDLEIGKFVAALPPNQRDAVNNADGGADVPDDIKKVISLKSMIHNQLGKIIEKDSRISRKIAGGSSFYSKAGK
ncbi:hypothetical protein NE664_08035 [Anaerotignum faecicola]|mgnify:FL=1|nr:hypothetical protein [Anaerotignum faecicola]